MSDLDMKALIIRVDMLEEWLAEVCKKAEVNRRVFLKSRHRDEIKEIIQIEEDRLEEEG